MSVTASGRTACTSFYDAANRSNQHQGIRNPRNESRIALGVSVLLERVLDLTKKFFSPTLMAVRQNCFAPDDLTFSMKLGDRLSAEAIRESSAEAPLGHGKNIILYLAHCLPVAMEIRNGAELIKMMRHILNAPTHR